MINWGHSRKEKIEILDPRYLVIVVTCYVRCLILDLLMAIISLDVHVLLCCLCSGDSSLAVSLANNVHVVIFAFDQQ